MRNFTHRWPQSGHFFSKLGHFFPIFGKGLRRPPPSSPFPPLPLFTRLRFYLQRAKRGLQKTEKRILSKLNNILIALNVLIFLPFNFTYSYNIRSSRPEVFCIKDVFRNFAKFTEKYLYQGFNFIKKETLAQMFSCVYCEISNNIFSYRTPPVTASVISSSPSTNIGEHSFESFW